MFKEADPDSGLKTYNQRTYKGTLAKGYRNPKCV